LCDGSPDESIYRVHAGLMFVFYFIFLFEWWRVALLCVILRYDSAGSLEEEEEEEISPYIATLEGF